MSPSQIAEAQQKASDIKAALEIGLIFEDAYWRSKALTGIAVALSKVKAE